MEQKKLSLNEKAALLQKRFRDNPSFTIADARSVLQEKPSTLNWTLYNLTQNGLISRIGQGLYSFQHKQETAFQPILSNLGSRILGILKETGYDFFVSGLDILSVFMEHVPESYPHLLFVEKGSIDEVADLLTKNGVDIIPDDQVKKYPAIRRISSVGEVVLLITTREFTYAENGLASVEKAFVDLYYEVSRRDYPLSLQELVRIFLNMRRRIALNTSRLIKIASRRNIHPDIRFIVDHGAITNAAHEFVNFLKKMGE
jgi:hypothetical protein